MKRNGITGVNFEGKKYVFYRTKGNADKGRLPGYIEQPLGLVYGWLKIDGDGFIFERRSMKSLFADAPSKRDYI